MERIRKEGNKGEQIEERKQKNRRETTREDIFQASVSERNMEKGKGNMERWKKGGGGRGRERRVDGKMTKFYLERGNSLLLIQEWLHIQLSVHTLRYKRSQGIYPPFLFL